MKNKIILYCDGGARLGQMALGYIGLNPNNEKEILFQGFKKCGKGTSNCAEYRSLIAGLSHCVKEKINIVHVFMDSKLVVQQINGAFKINNKILKDHKEKSLELLSNFEDWSLGWVPRHKNKLADELVNKAFVKKKKNVPRNS
jgi:ribonuclease HI